MQKMKSISQQHSQMTGDDRSPEELQKVFEKVEITIPPSTPPTDEVSCCPGLLAASNVLKEKDPNLVTSNNSLHLSHHTSPPPSLHPNDPHYPCSLQGNQPSGSSYYHNSSAGNNSYNNYSCSPSTGHHYLFGGSRASSLSGTESSTGIGSLSSPVTSTCPSPATCPFLGVTSSGHDENMMQSQSETGRFVSDADFCYTDFARRGEASEFTTFRVQDYSWDDHGFSLVNQLYNDVGNLLDDKFKVTYNMTYYT